jgi:NAD(P)-dependent dehydrogenase (short-subunit alcohol dehydrogenase family)
MEISVAGLRVLITAAGSGIGKVVAKRFMDEGATVHIGDVSEQLVTQAQKDIPGLSATVADAANPVDGERLVDEAVAHMERLDCLINNSGVKGPTGPVERLDAGEWDQSIDINLNGHFYVARAAVPHLKAAGGGSIITTSSSAGRLGYPNRTPYAAAKWALIGFSHSLAMELGLSNIRANAILPGVVKGDRMERVLKAEAEAEGISVEEARERAVRSTSMRAMIDPVEIADLAIFLSSDAGRHISGQAIGICGNQETLAT